METIEVLQLDENDIEFANILTRYGLTENEGKVLVCVKTFESVTPKEIMQVTDLTQSAVSVAVNGLIEKEYVWVAKNEIRKEGKGRPSSTYSLHKSMSEIIDEIEKETIRQIETIDKSIERLKELTFDTMPQEDTKIE